MSLAGGFAKVNEHEATAVVSLNFYLYSHDSEKSNRPTTKVTVDSSAKKKRLSEQVQRAGKRN